MNASRSTWAFTVRTYGLLLSCLVAAIAAADRPQARAAEPPAVKVTSVRQVFHNGQHNAFTDLCRFQGQLYLTFRSCPDGHPVHPTSSIIVLASPDGNQWRQVHRFAVPKRDTRDPHFLVFRDKLFVYTGTWYCGDRSPKQGDYEYDLNRHLGYAAWTPDGRQWNGPVMLEGTYGHYIWRAAAYGGKAYLCGRRKHEFAEFGQGRGYPRAIVESAMLESEDGLIWKKAALFKEHDGDETAFLFEPDGSVLAVARGGSATLCRSRPPYQEWQYKDLGRTIGGPLLARWGDRYLVGGRKTVGGKPTTALYWLVNDELRQCAELPSAGDNSYPGFIELGPARALVSYYSSHEKDAAGKTITAIYLAELAIEEATAGRVADQGGISAEERLKIEQAIPARPYAAPKRPRKLLIFDLNVGYPGHRSIPYANLAFTLMGRKTGAFDTVVSRDPAVFRPESLKQFDAVLLNNTVGNLFKDAELRRSLAQFVSGGGGLLGIHGSSVAFTDWPGAHEDWPEFGLMLGARGANHRDNDERVFIKLDDPDHPVNQAFGGKGFEYRDEFFRFHEPYSRDRVRVLLSIDVQQSGISQGKARGKVDRPDNDYALAWVRSQGKGRVFYSTIGHNPYVFWDKMMLKFYLAAAQFALGDLPGSTTPSNANGGGR